MNETPEQVLLDNQSEIIKKIESINPIEIWEEKTIATFDIKSEQGDVLVKMDSDFQFDKIKSLFSWDIWFVADIKSKDASWKWDLKISALIKDKIFYMKLDDFNVDIPWQQWVDFIKMMIKWYIWKWISMDLWNQDLNLSASLLNFNEFLKIYKKYSVFKSIKINEDKDFYNYDISLNKENIIKMYEESNDGNNELIKDFKENLDKIDFSWNIKIDPNNKDYFIFSSDNKDFKINIVNNKDVLELSLSADSSEAKVNFKKKKDWVTWNISLLESSKEVLSWSIDISFSSSNLELLWDFSFQSATLKMDIKSSYKAKKEVNIVSPKDSQTFEEVMWWFMWWALWIPPTSDNMQKDIPFSSDSWVQINSSELKVDINTNDIEDEVQDVMNEIEWLSDMQGLEELLK